MQKTTVHTDEYQKKLQDRATASKPKDSGILKGEGKLNAVSTNANEFTAKRGERYDKSVPKNNQILNVRKVDNSVGNNNGMIFRAALKWSFLRHLMMNLNRKHPIDLWL